MIKKQFFGLSILLFITQSTAAMTFIQIQPKKVAHFEPPILINGTLANCTDEPVDVTITFYYCAQTAIFSPFPPMSNSSHEAFIKGPVKITLQSKEAKDLSFLPLPFKKWGRQFTREHIAGIAQIIVNSNRNKNLAFNCSKKDFSPCYTIEKHNKQQALS